MVRKRRRNSLGQPLCDMCGEAHGAERHHIITRARTIGSAHAASLANGPDITALLCRECHNTIDIPANRDALLQKLYLINGQGDGLKGYEIMKRSFDAATEGIWIQWELPMPSSSSK